MSSALVFILLANFIVCSARETLSFGYYVYPPYTGFNPETNVLEGCDINVAKALMEKLPPSVDIRLVRLKTFV